MNYPIILPKLDYKIDLINLLCNMTGHMNELHHIVWTLADVIENKI